MADKEKEIKKLKQKLKQAEQQAQEYLNGWKRAKADYINKEREIEKDKLNWVKFANLELILKLLPVLDSFDQSLSQIPDNLKSDSWVKGVIQIKNQFDNLLKDQGIGKIKTIGEKFNPEFHEVVEKKGDNNEIIEEIQSGYIMHEKVIRPAKVIIK